MQSYTKPGNQAYNPLAFWAPSYFLCKAGRVILTLQEKKKNETDICHLQELFIIGGSHIHRTHLTIISPGHL